MELIVEVTLLLKGCLIVWSQSKGNCTLSRDFGASGSPLVFADTEEDRKPLWIDHISLLCMLGKLFDLFHVQTC